MKSAIGSVSVTAGVAAILTVIRMAAAQEAAGNAIELQEVVVTAEKTATNLQSTATSVVAVSGQDVADQGRNDIRDVLSSVGGVSFSGGGAGNVSLNIRGIEGSTAGLPGKTDAGASLYQDGIVLSDLLGGPSSAAFYDVARVEVLRGPQGTLYGRGAEGGTVNVITNNPGNDFALGGALELGNYRLQHAQGMINLPLGSEWAIRAAYNSVKRKGYYSSGLDAVDTSSSRIKLRYDAGGKFTALFGGEVTLAGGPMGAGVVGTGTAAWGLGNPPTDAWDDVTKNGGLTGTVPGSTQNRELIKLWSQLDLSTGVGNLTVIPGYTRVNNKDTILSVAGNVFTGLIANQYVTVQNLTDGNAKSVEARLVSPDGSRIKWMLGGYYDKATAYIFTGTFSRRDWQDQSSYAGFAQATLPLGEKWGVIGGLRSGRDEKSYSTNLATATPRPGAGSRSWTRTDWKVGVENHLTDDSLLYATVATGYRPGGVDNTATDTLIGLGGVMIPNSYQFTKPEYLTSYEVGSKNEFFDHRLRLNGDVYYHSFENEQYDYFTATASRTAACPNGAAPSVFGTDVVCQSLLNAGPVHALGAELDALWLITRRDEVSVSLSLLSSKVSDTQVIQLSIPPGTVVPAGYTVSGANVVIDTKDATTARSPKSQVNAYYQHSFDLGVGSLSLRGDVHYLGESHINGFNYLNPAVASSGTRTGDLYIVSANTRYDASVNYAPSQGNWNLNIYGKNLGNKAVKAFVTGANVTVDPPRTFGVVLTAHL